MLASPFYFPRSQWNFLLIQNYFLVLLHTLFQALNWKPTSFWFFMLYWLSLFWSVFQFVNKFNVMYDRQGMGRRMRGLFFWGPENQINKSWRTRSVSGFWLVKTVAQKEAVNTSSADWRIMNSKKKWYIFIMSVVWHYDIMFYKNCTCIKWLCNFRVVVWMLRLISSFGFNILKWEWSKKMKQIILYMINRRDMLP